MTKRSKKDETPSKKEKEIASILSFNPNIDYDYGNPKSNYFTLCIVLLPSILAVVIPVMPNSPSSKDIAILITDSLIIIIITWFIKFIIEWPWKWLHEIRSAKEKLLNNVNSNHLIHNVSHAEIQSQINENILLIEKLIYYESISLGMGIIGHFLSSLIMIWTRNFIIVEETRKNIVFSNLNVSIFFIWGTFKIIIVFLQKFKDRSLIDNEYNLINEFNLHDFYKSVEIFQDKQHLDSHDNSKDDVTMSSKDDLNLDLTDNLTDDVKDVKLLKERLMQSINLFEQKEKQIQVYELKLNQIIENYKFLITDDIRNKPFKPFPLNINDQSTLRPSNPLIKSPPVVSTKSGVKLKAFKHDYDLIGNNLGTIFEEEPFHDVQPESASVPIVNTDSYSYSLHGLPPTSKFKQIVTRSDVSYVSDENSEIYHNVFNEIFDELLNIMRRLNINYSVRGIFQNPFLLKYIIKSEFIPFIIKIDNSTLKIFQKIIIIRTIIWQILDKHLLINLRSFNIYLFSLLEKYSRLFNTILVFWVDCIVGVPYFIASIVAPVFFIPRLIIHIFIIYPITKLTKEDFKAREFNLKQADKRMESSSDKLKS